MQRHDYRSNSNRLMSRFELPAGKQLCCPAFLLLFATLTKMGPQIELKITTAEFCFVSVSKRRIVHVGLLVLVSISERERPTSLRYTVFLILSFHLRLGCTTGLFPPGLPVVALYAPLSIRAKGHVRLILHLFVFGDVDI
jgi:hypothetical protein